MHLNRIYSRISRVDGYTEIWVKALLKVSSIRQILDWTYMDESK